jgi:hypothetical protein
MVSASAERIGNSRGGEIEEMDELPDHITTQHEFCFFAVCNDD